MAILSAQNKKVLKNRFKSFLWRAGMILVALVIDFILANLELLNLSSEVVVVIGLVLGEVSKYLNVNLPELRGKA